MTPAQDTPPSGLGLRRLSFNIGTTLVRQLLATVFGLATAAMIARSLGPSGNGQYAVVILLPTFLATFLNLGISPANVYYVGRHSVSPAVAYRASLQIWFVVAVLGVGLGALSVLFRAEQWFPGVPSALLWLALVSFPLGLLQAYLSSLFQAVQDFRRFNLAVVAAPAIMFFLVLGLLLLRVSVAAVVVAAVLTQFFTLAITYLLLLKSQILTIPQQSVGISNDGYGVQAIRYGYKAHLSNILTFLNYRADIFLVNLLINPAAVGIYAISVAMSEKLWLLSHSVSTVILPRLSELHTNDDVRRQLTPLLARWVLIISAIAASLLAMLAQFLIGLIFGNAYEGAVAPLLFLLPGIVLVSSTRVLANDIAARGRPELNMYISFVVLIINIVANLFLIPRWELSGAALATTIAYIVQSILLIWMYCRLSGSSWHVLFSFGPQDARILNQLSPALTDWKRA